MTTPLASIIGSGFLVLGPILDAQYGKYAPLVMAALCVGAYLYGAAIRYNMVTIEAVHRDDQRLVRHLDTLASWSLGFAYIVSVAYYLNLFGAFGVSLTAANDPLNARLLTTAIFAIILFVGWTRGFRSLERMEYVSVGTKLAIIAGLLLGLAIYFGEQLSTGSLIFNASELSGWPAITLAFGLIVTVQGFETSRYLGATYDRAVRLREQLEVATNSPAHAHTGPTAALKEGCHRSVAYLPRPGEAPGSPSPRLRPRDPRVRGRSDPVSGPGRPCSAPDSGQSRF